MYVLWLAGVFSARTTKQRFLFCVCLVLINPVSFGRSCVLSASLCVTLGHVDMDTEMRFSLIPYKNSHNGILMLICENI